MDGYCMLRRALLIKSIKTVQYALFAIEGSVQLNDGPKVSVNGVHVGLCNVRT